MLQSASDMRKLEGCLVKKINQETWHCGVKSVNIRLYKLLKMSYVKGYNTYIAYACLNWYSRSHAWVSAPKIIVTLFQELFITITWILRLFRLTNCYTVLKSCDIGNLVYELTNLIDWISEEESTRLLPSLCCAYPI